MHQSHNIPWHLLERNITFIHNNKNITPTRSGFFYKDTPHGAGELNHLVSKLSATIRAFSDTERAKYPQLIPPRSTGPLFSRELQAKYPGFLKSDKLRHIEFWVSHFPKHADGGQCGPWMDVVNVLLAENEMEPLLMLAQHPQINMKLLHNYSWGHHFGFCRAKETAIDAAQQVPHVAFYRKVGALDAPYTNPVHEDYEALRQYMKDVFAIMYRYDVLARECGIEPKWEESISMAYPLHIFGSG